MKVQPQVIPTPSGCLVGYKAVTKGRYPMFMLDRSKNHKYVIGETYTAIVGAFGTMWGFESFQSARELRECRRKHCVKTKRRTSDEACLPGIHVCRDIQSARVWASWESYPKIIPVAYSPRSIVGTKGASVVVVYRVKVLG